jgi:hypothetical protein
MGEKVNVPGFTGWQRATSLRSQVVRVFHARPFADALSTWQGAVPAPLAFPPVQGLRPMKIPPPSARGGRARGPLGRGRGALTGALCVSGDTPAVSAAASTRRAFVPSMDLQTVGDFALPPDPHRPAARRLDQRQGFRAHGPRTGRAGAPVPPPNPGRIGCAPAARAAKTISAPCTAWTARPWEAHTWTS